MNWQLKAVLPVAFVLLNGLSAVHAGDGFVARPGTAYQVLIVAGAGAVAICAVIMLVLAYLVQRPMVELQEKIARVGNGESECGVGLRQAQ